MCGPTLPRWNTILPSNCPIADSTGLNWELDRKVSAHNGWFLINPTKHKTKPFWLSIQAWRTFVSACYASISIVLVRCTCIIYISSPVTSRFRNECILLLLSSDSQSKIRFMRCFLVNSCSRPLYIHQASLCIQTFSIATVEHLLHQNYRNRKRLNQNCAWLLHDNKPDSHFLLPDLYCLYKYDKLFRASTEKNLMATTQRFSGLLDSQVLSSSF